MRTRAHPCCYVGARYGVKFNDFISRAACALRRSSRASPASKFRSPSTTPSRANSSRGSLFVHSTCASFIPRYHVLVSGRLSCHVDFFRPVQLPLKLRKSGIVGERCRQDHDHPILDHQHHAHPGVHLTRRYRCATTRPPGDDRGKPIGSSFCADDATAGRIEG